MNARALAAPALVLLLGHGDRPAPYHPLAAVKAEPACPAMLFEGSRFTVCPVNARRDRVTLTVAGPNGAPLRSLAALAATLGPARPDVRFAMNAGMYGEDRWPVGLYVEHGRVRRPLNRAGGAGNFHLLPNGVFAVDRDGRMSVTESRRFRRSGARPAFATQSGPMLVIRGKLHPRFSAEGESKLIRNGVGVRDPAHAFFVISDDPVSFGRFARLFRDGLQCPDALFLDGSVSSLWDPGAERMDPYARLGPLVVVYRSTTR